MTIMMSALKNRLRPFWYRLQRVVKPPQRWPSETSKCRLRLAPYCSGVGVDLGFGGDPITPSALRMDMPNQYGAVGIFPPQLIGNAAHLIWFRDGVLDYVYSSHLLEDFHDTEAVISEWLRVIKPGGRLVLFCPDERRYRAHCDHTGQPYNIHHVHTDFSLTFVKAVLDRVGGTHVIYESPDVDVYSWDLVVEKMPAYHP